MEPVGERTLTIHTPGVYMPDDFKIARQSPLGLEDLLEAEGDYCPVCFPLSRDLGVFSAPGTEDPKVSKLYVSWDVYLRDLIGSAEKNCQFCCFMITRFFNDPFYTFFWQKDPDNPIGCCSKDPEIFKNEKVAKAITRTREMCEKYGNPRFRLIAQPDDWNRRTGRYERLRFLVRDTNLTTAAAIEKILGYRRQIVIEISALEGDELGKELTARPIDVDPTTTESVSLVNAWINDCVENHADCSKPLDHPANTSTAEASELTVPTRLIKIAQDSDDLMLVSSPGPVRYTILDCIGDIQKSVVTAAHNLEARQNGFKVTDLPKAFQDAVTVIKKMGIEYLWASPLCINTSSEEETAKEKSRSSVYLRNAYLTISLGDKISEEGFLKKRSQCTKHPDQKVSRDLNTILFLSPAGECDRVYFREESPYDLADESISAEARSYETRLLSSRILTYGARLMWQCRRHLKSHGGVQDWSHGEQILEDRKIMLALHRANQGKPLQPDDFDPNEDKIEITESLYDLWYSATKEFSRRKVQDPEEILPALAVIAERFSHPLQDKYVAGLWKKDLLRGLLWSTWPHPTPKKPETWRAPSWSWASITGPHSYERLPARDDAVELATITKVTSSLRDDSAPFGAIIDATVEMRAPLIDAEPAQIEAFVRKQYTAPGPRDSPEWRKLMMRAGQQAPHFENRIQIPAGSKYLMILAKEDAPNVSAPEAERIGPEEKTATVSGLVVAPNKHGTAYERVVAFDDLHVKGYQNLQQRVETVLLL